MNRKGVALLLALFILILASLLVIAFLELTTTDLSITSNHLTRNQALYIADAGVEYAISILKSDKSNFSSGAIEFPSGSANTYSVTYSSISGKIIPDSQSLGKITSVATLNSGQLLSLEAKVSVRGGNPPYNVKIVSWREL